MRESSRNLNCQIEDLQDLKLLSEEWQALQKISEVPYFLSWDWIGSWLLLKSSYENIKKISIYDGEILVALALFSNELVTRHKFIQSRIWYLHEYGNSGLNMMIEYNGVLVARDYAYSAPGKIIEGLLNLQNEWDELQISGICEDNPLIDQEYINGLGLEIEERAVSYSRYVDLENLRKNNIDYLSTLSRNTRYQIRRSIKGYNNEGELNISVADGVDECLNYFHELGKLHQEYWEKKGEPGSFSNKNWVLFHENLIKASVGNGGVQLVKISAGERIVGYLYNLVQDGNIFMIQSGLNYEGDKKLHPGYVSHYLTIQYNIDKGYKKYDFLAGEARYKRSLSNDQKRLIWLKLQKRSLLFKLEKILRKAVRYIRRKDDSLEF